MYCGIHASNTLIISSYSCEYYLYSFVSIVFCNVYPCLLIQGICAYIRVGVELTANNTLVVPGCWCKCLVTPKKDIRKTSRGTGFYSYWVFSTFSSQCLPCTWWNIFINQSIYLPVHPLYQSSPGTPTLDHYTVYFQLKTPTSSLTIFLTMTYHIIRIVEVVQVLFRYTYALSMHGFLGVNAELTLTQWIWPPITDLVGGRAIKPIFFLLSYRFLGLCWK